jgi:hypothetical protein
MVVRRVIRAFGLVVAIETDAPDFFELLDPQLPSFPEERETAPPQLSYRVKVRARGGLTVLRGRRTLATVPDVPAASVSLVSDLQSAMARRAARWTFVHAGVVAIDGRALLLPGRSHAGKSTLVAALIEAGAGYCSDEFAVIDSAGRVHPYSRPLALRSPSRRVGADALGGHVISESVQVGAVCFTEFAPGTEFVITPVSSAEVVLRLMSHCLGVRGRPAETMAALQAASSHARGFAGNRGDAAAAAAVLMERCRSEWFAADSARADPSATIRVFDAPRLTEERRVSS